MTSDENLRASDEDEDEEYDVGALEPDARSVSSENIEENDAHDGDIDHFKIEHDELPASQANDELLETASNGNNENTDPDPLAAEPFALVEVGEMNQTDGDVHQAPVKDESLGMDPVRASLDAVADVSNASDCMIVDDDVKTED